jgi:uncharacterized membrane protein HdeD (DUF308 family)
MKLLRSSVFRAVCAIVIGALLIMYPDNTVTGITIAIGVLFLLSGVISVLTYVQARRHVSDYKIYDAEGRLISGQQPTFPIVSIGSMILGFVLALTPTTFVSALMYIIGIMLVLGALNQYLALIAGRRYGRISPWFWVMPTVILLFGLYMMIKPMDPLKTAMYFLGWGMLVYGIVELVNALKFYSDKKRVEQAQDQQQLDAFEEIKE